MSKRLPSLNALRVFVAVARSGGVSRAAEELNLTHSAVSHQIRSLQSELGVTLFEKSGRGLMLTEQARAYVQRIESAFKEIEEATLDVTTHNRHRLRISTIPSFAARWLLPRLGDFIATCPDVDVEVQSSHRAADVKGGEVDIGIRFDTGPHPGLYSERLMRDWLFPVCSPEFAKKYALCDASGIDGVPLMHSEREPWSSWFPAAGIVADEPEHGILFNDSALMLQAAAAGQGLCLARQSIVYDELQSGRLVRPFSTYVESPFSYFFVCRREKLAAPPIAAFRTWIVRQIKNIPLLD
ncbi:MAG: transcriptional regulator GcvA [Propionivibrio sp.]|jgi:LysR family glycine cleavage system transcriptional activator|uniref:transcriptional regulator GcvA n=1 Tax=Propionivibrio sp. TaxID=2212460 RepID=UPI001B70FCA6|nr:transcriptional regulator GcvA [Propionivibrio sp.]MBP7202980.1 transcriptional regulator GcvA [Propionivibrio sp.]